MKKFLFAFLILGVASFWLVTSEVWGQYSSFIPTWKVGDQWKVETNPIAFGMPKKAGPMMKSRVKEKAHVTFQVESIKEIEKTRCFVVKITNTVMPSSYSEMYIRVKDFTLKRYVEVLKRSSGKDSRKVVNNPSKPFVVEQMGILCPMDFPQFPNMDKDQVIKTTLGLGNNKLIEMVSFNKEKTKSRIEMRVKINGQTLRSIQYWNQGYPWWSKAERVWGKEKWEIGKLVSYKLVKRKGR